MARPALDHCSGSDSSMSGSRIQGWGRGGGETVAEPGWCVSAVLDDRLAPTVMVASHN
jgi:hypothetical protein